MKRGLARLQVPLHFHPLSPTFTQAQHNRDTIYKVHNQIARCSYNPLKIIPEGLPANCSILGVLFSQISNKQCTVPAPSNAQMHQKVFYECIHLLTMPSLLREYTGSNIPVNLGAMLQCRQRAMSHRLLIERMAMTCTLRHHLLCHPLPTARRLHTVQHFNS